MLDKKEFSRNFLFRKFFLLLFLGSFSFGVADVHKIASRHEQLFRARMSTSVECLPRKLTSRQGCSKSAGRSEDDRASVIEKTSIFSDVMREEREWGKA